MYTHVVKYSIMITPQQRKESTILPVTVSIEIPVIKKNMLILIN